MNSLGDLNMYLFEQLERLDEISEEKLVEEVKRAKAVSQIADTIIENGKLVLEAERFRDAKWNADAELPSLLEGDL